MSWFSRSVLAGFAVAALPALASACGSSAPPQQTASATSGGGGGSAPVYGSSDCGMCVEKTACLSQVNACKGDPGCAAYLDCLDACPLGPTGDADVACENACPAVSGSAGQSAKEALIACRTSGPGATTCNGCGQIDEPTNMIFQQMCSASTETNKCFVCEDEHCCDTYNQCHADQDCEDLSTCLKACSSTKSGPVCRDECYQDHTAGYAHYAPRIACLFHFCADSTDCGDVPLDPCIKCQNLHCGDETAACQLDLQCQLLDDCQTPCEPTDTACFSACQTKFPEGQATQDARSACIQDHCGIACGGTTP